MRTFIFHREASVGNVVSKLPHNWIVMCDALIFHFHRRGEKKTHAVNVWVSTGSARSARPPLFVPRSRFSYSVVCLVCFLLLFFFHRPYFNLRILLCFFSLLPLLHNTLGPSCLLAEALINTLVLTCYVRTHSY